MSRRSPTEADAAAKRKAMTSNIAKAPTSMLLQTAGDIVASRCENSEVFDSATESRIPKFDIKELTLGRVLGRGGFCVVREIERIKTPSSAAFARSLASSKSKSSVFSFLKSKSRLQKVQQPSYMSDLESDNGTIDHHSGTVIELKYSRDFVASRSKRSRSNGGYVIKRVALELKHSNKIEYMKGAVDLAMETKFLASLDHPNVISLAGSSSTGPFSDGYFLVLEKLTETLSGRFKTWTNIDRQCKGITGMFTGSKSKVYNLYRERVEASYDIASAVAYLHQKNIIFRDLKPDNIGFDTRGELKVFDFGLAKELNGEKRNKDGLYKLTGFTGAIRYMAPEVGLNKRYNLSADVYSWSMIMWFIMALEPPFGFYTNEMIIDRVHKRGSRPAVFRHWPESIGSLLQRCWTADISLRPSFKEIVSTLKVELIECDTTVTSSLNGSMAETIPEHRSTAVAAN